MLIIKQMEECLEQTVNKVYLLIFESYSMRGSPFPAMYQMMAKTVMFIINRRN